MGGKPIFISKCGELILTNSTSEHSSLSYSLSNLHQVLFSKRCLVIAIKHFFFFGRVKSQTRCLIRPTPNCSCTHTLAAFPPDNMVALCLPDTEVLWDHQSVSFAFIARRRQEGPRSSLVFFSCSFSGQRWRSTHNTEMFPRMYALG